MLNQPARGHPAPAAPLTRSATKSTGCSATSEAKRPTGEGWALNGGGGWLSGAKRARRDPSQWCGLLRAGGHLISMRSWR